MDVGPEISGARHPTRRGGFETARGVQIAATTENGSDRREGGGEEGERTAKERKSEHAQRTAVLNEHQ